MLNKISIILFFILFTINNFTLSCEPERQILFNGKIFSGTNGNLSQAVVFHGSKIIFTGTNFEAKKFMSGDRVKSVDLKGKIVLPGFHDGDMNFLLGAGLMENNLNFYGLDLYSIIHRLKIEIKKQKAGEIYGYNFEHLLIKNNKWPNKYDLDKVSGKLPVIVYSSDGNIAWVNSTVLKLCGIGKNTPEVQGGRIIRFEDNEPTGILSGNSLNLLINFSFRKSIQKVRPDKRKIVRAIKYLNSLGLTSVTTLGDLELVKTLGELDSEKKLNIRFNVVLPSKNIGRYLINKVGFNNGTSFVRIISLTKKIDGNLYTSDAAMFSPYWKSKRYGFLRTNKNDISDVVTLYKKNGIVGDFHAEGDRGVNIVLNGIQASTRSYSENDHRYRISNFIFVIKEDIDRLKHMNVIPVIRPSSLMEKFALIERLVGERKAADAFRAGSLLNSGVILAFGSGWPGDVPDPLKGIKFSVFRIVKGTEREVNGWFQEERISIRAAILAHTFAPAYSVLNDKMCGSIEKGKFSDFTIIDGDIFSEDLNYDLFSSAIRVAETIIDGRTVFRNPD